jgi:hypothetical protein
MDNAGTLTADLVSHLRAGGLIDHEISAGVPSIPEPGVVGQGRS